MRDPRVPLFQDSASELELALIEEFLHEHGSDLAALALLAPAERQRLLHDASLYAASHLAEIWAHAPYGGDLLKH